MNIAFIGNITNDLTVSGEKFIEEGGRVSFFEDEVTSTVGGPAANACSVAVKFNKDSKHNIDFYGQIGNDANGKFILDEILKESIDMNHINITNNVMTPFSFIIINRTDNTRTICSVRSRKDYTNPKIENIEYETKYDYILTDGKYVEDSIELIKKNPQATSIIDAGRVNDGILRLCHIIDYIICSDDFAEKVTGIKLGNPANDYLAYKKLKETFPDAKGITITVGARGYICEENNQVVNYPAFNSGKPAIDTNAAGDIFHGGFTYAMASGYDYHDSLRFANITASLSTTKVGGRKSCPELEEVNSFFKGDDLNNDKAKILIR